MTTADQLPGDSRVPRWLRVTAWAALALGGTFGGMWTAVRGVDTARHERTVAEEERQYQRKLEREEREAQRAFSTFDHQAAYCDAVAEREATTAEKLLNCRNALSGGGSHLTGLIALIDSDSGLSWCKRRVAAYRYRYVRVSPGVAKLLFNDMAEAYDGRYDHDLWPKEQADTYAASDEMAWKSRRGGSTPIEDPIDSIDTGARGVAIGRKIAFYTDGAGYVCGVARYNPGIMGQTHQIR